MSYTYKDMTGVPYRCNDCLHECASWFKEPCLACSISHCAFERRTGGNVIHGFFGGHDYGSNDRYICRSTGDYFKGGHE